MLEKISIGTIENPSFETQLYDLGTKSHSKLHVMIDLIPDEEKLNQLQVFIENHSPCSFSKLSIQVDLDTLKSDAFLTLLKQLNPTLISGLELFISNKAIEEANDSIIDLLTQTIAPIVSYPLHIKESDTQKPVFMQHVQNTIIANIQKRNKEPNDHLPVLNNMSNKDSNHPLAKPIKLKDLIKKKAMSRENLVQYMPLEIQHVETVEQEINEQQEETIEIQQTVELQELQVYEGQVLGFKEFNTPAYKSKVNARTQNEALTDSLFVLLEKECFANLPHAIKYATPEAAEYLAFHLPALVSLNKDNLPDGFILKQTQDEALVLDYDPHLENEHANPFTPALSEIEPNPIYMLEFSEEQVNTWVNDEVLFAILCPSDRPYRSPSQVLNLWIQHGDEGVLSFFKELKAATQSQPDLAPFILEHYLVHLPQWEHLYNNTSFIKSLERISHYDEEKLKCLKRFLQHTGSSNYDLNKASLAFDVFWNEFNLLCTEHKTPLAETNKSNWSTPNGGDPVVYMERMLFILKNARCLNEQLTLLNNLSLSNYGAYYASRFEDFKTVSEEMALIYNPEKQNAKPFNKNSSLHKVELDRLSERLTPYYMRQFYNSDPTDGYLVDCTNELPQPLNYTTLNDKGLIIPFTEKAFIPPYQLSLYTTKI